MKYRKTKRVSSLDYSMPFKTINLGNNNEFLTNKLNYSMKHNDIDPCTSAVPVILLNSKNNTSFNNKLHSNNFPMNDLNCYNNLSNIEKPICSSVIMYNSNNHKLNDKLKVKQNNNIEKNEFIYKNSHFPNCISPPSSPHIEIPSNDSQCDLIEMSLSPKHRDFSRTTPLRKNLIQVLNLAFN